MESVKNYLSSFSDNFLLALMFWPLVSALITLPVLAYLYHRDGGLRVGSIIGVYLSVLYVLGLGCFTLWPLPEGNSGPGITYGVHPNFNPFEFVVYISKEGMRGVFQLLFNVVLFFPLGFIFGRFLQMRAIPSVALSACVSILIEVTQLTGLFGIYAYPYRCCDIDDVITNTLGGLLGWLIAHWLNKKFPQKEVDTSITANPGLIRRGVALWIDFTLISVSSMALGSIPFLIYKAATGHSLRLFGESARNLEDSLIWIILVCIFLIIEVIIPWFHAGRTPGGSFVRMTCEGKERTKRNRVLFYVARTVILGLLMMIPWLFGPVLLVFYLFARKMPYDFVH